MKRLMLVVTVLLVYLGSYAQEEENQIPIKTMKEAKPMEWFISIEEDAQIIYGSKFEMNGEVYLWFDENGMDITSPHKVKTIKGRPVHYWYTKNKFGDDLEVAFYDHENSKTFKVRVIHS